MSNTKRSPRKQDQSELVAMAKMLTVAHQIGLIRCLRCRIDLEELWADPSHPQWNAVRDLIAIARHQMSEVA